MGKFKLNLDVKALDLNKTVMKDPEGTELTLGKVLGLKLVGSSKGDALKFHRWAEDLYGGKTIEVDKSDLKKIRDFVEGHETLTNLVKAPILTIIDDTKEEE